MLKSKWENDQKKLVWKDITSPGGDADFFVFEGRKYCIAELLKEDSNYSECKKLCRVYTPEIEEKAEFAIIASYIRIDKGSATRRQAILSGPVDDIAIASSIFEKARG